MPSDRHDPGHAVVCRDLGDGPVQSEGLHAPIEGGHHVEGAYGGVVAPEVRVGDEHYQQHGDGRRGDAEKGIGGAGHSRPGYLRPGTVGEEPAREGYRDPRQPLEADDAQEQPGGDEPRGQREVVGHLGGGDYGGGTGQ